MKSHISFSIWAVLAAAVFCSGCASQPPPPPSTNANVAVAEPTPDNAAIEAELTRIENDWPRIIKERDAATVQKVEADDIMIVYPDGTPGSKDQDLKDIGSGAFSADSWEVTDLTIKILNKDSAVASLRNVIKGGSLKAPDGRTQDISGEYRSVDTFARRNGQWVIVATVSVPVKNPLPSTSPTPAGKASPSMKPSPTVKPSPTTRSSPAMKASPKATTSPA